MYLNFVKRAIRILKIIPANIIIAVDEPYLVKATATIASLLGTTPERLNACSNIFPKGFKEFRIIPAPPETTKKPTNVLIPPFIISGNVFFCKINPIIAIKATKIAGVLTISKINFIFLSS